MCFEIRVEVDSEARTLTFLSDMLAKIEGKPSTTG